MPKRLQKTLLKDEYGPPRKPPKKSRRGRWLFFFFLLVGVTGAWGYYKIRMLGKIVEEKFNVTKRWNIPSRVYSDTEYLYPGLDISLRDLKPKLERLGYRQIPAEGKVPGEIKGPGDFLRQTGRIDIYLHDFAYPQEKFSGFPVRLEMEGLQIKRILDLESGEELTLLRLEPEEIATLFDEKMEDRTLIHLEECPQTLLQAVILIEDERFFRHRGVDPAAILRAALADLLTLKLSQGGSTLTQQLIKNYFLTSEKSLSRKINEALMALVLERRHPKSEILEAYLNEIYLGQRGPSSVTGVGEAVKHYFAKDIHQITLAESALLAGMIRNPSRYSPLNNVERAKERRDFVLKRMLDAEVIDATAYQAALAEAIIPPKPKLKPIVAPYFIDFLKLQIVALYPEEVLQTEGLKIFTTLDMAAQLRADRALREGLARLQSTQARLLPKDHPQGLEGCMVVMSPQNGYVRAMVGGKDYVTSQYNRCTQAARQPGSTFKPFVYLTALDPSRSQKTFTPASLIEDTHFTLDTVQGPWSPDNYDHREHGMVTLRQALEQSYNIATAKLAMDAGLEAVVRTAREAGISSPLSAVPSLSLGAFEVSPLELASAYGIFPNRGVRAEPLSVIHIMTPDGEVLEKKNLKIRKVFDELPVALTTHILKGVLERGTAAAARSLGFRGIAAGKTGTSSDYRDAWFVGFTPQLLSLVWVGFDDNVSLKMSGARAALPIWAAFMKEAVGDSQQDFTFPSNLVQVNIDPLTGELATKACSQTITEFFLPGTEPSEKCRHGGGKDFPLSPGGSGEPETLREEF